MIHFFRSIFLKNLHPQKTIALATALVVILAFLSPGLIQNLRAVAASDEIRNEASVIEDDPVSGEIAEEVIDEVIMDPEEEKEDEERIEEAKEIPDPSTAGRQVRNDSVETRAVPEEGREVETTKEEPLNYTMLMRSFSDVQKAVSQNEFSETADQRNQLSLDLAKFTEEETERLTAFKIDRKKKDAYLDRLNAQLATLNLNGTGSSLVLDAYKAEASQNKVNIPEKPGSFRFERSQVELQTLTAQKEAGALASGELVTLPASQLPVLEDVQDDGTEIVLTSQIRDLAASLNNNPVEMVNFVRNQITYEPYYGAKKGASGCLAERVCNDTDASALTISLLRAAGIPARYKKSLALMPAETLQNLLGVEETKTVYAALFWNKVPVFVEADPSNPLTDFDTHDFTQETHLIVEWVFTEAFYEYDERGGNLASELSFRDATTTQEVHDLLLPFPKKQWVPLDPVIRPYAHTQNEIVHDTAAFNTEVFWNGFFQYQGALSPLQKYTEELLIATGKDINDPLYQSVKTPQQQSFDLLPPNLPYVLVSAMGMDPETWSSFPDSRRYRVIIRLTKESDGSLVLEKNFKGSQVDNREMLLSYEGATPADQTVIDSYGGIHATPADLVDIVPYLQTEFGRFDAAANIDIGQTLILEFEFLLNGAVWEDSQKFSVAGNNEGIYIVLSKVRQTPLLDTNSKILLQGNAAIAREYLRKIEEGMEFLEKALDHEYVNHFSRAVVTQNRILSEMNGLPTTFDFEGLTMDATSFISDYSSRGNYKSHQEDFLFLAGQSASYNEAKIFEDITGLDSISTVQGLQHAHASPSQYTVHTIDITNESVIDTLQLSQNTKDNMHADVQAGRTIITPDKPVTDQIWTGIFYVSYDDTNFLYAIGEQVQNGGWTTAGFVIYQHTNPDTGDIGTYAKYQGQLNGDDNFIFQDDTLKDLNCRISETTTQDIANDPNYYYQYYGPPCMRDTRTFGTVDHTFTLTSEAAKFEGGGLTNGYWIMEASAMQTIENDSVNEANIGNSITFDDTKFHFSSIAGTYEWEGTSSAGKTVGYYQPSSDNANQGYGWMVYGEMHEILTAEDFYGNSIVLSKLGYPTSNRVVTGISSEGTYGEYQNFIGGDIYENNDNDTFYIPEPIRTHFDTVGGGTSGIFGFPVRNPIEVTVENKVFQEFEKGRIKAEAGATSNGEVLYEFQVQLAEEDKPYYWEGLADTLFEFGLYEFSTNIASGVAISQVIKNAKKVFGKKIIKNATISFVPALGWAILAYSVYVTVDQVTLLNQLCNATGNFNPPPPAYFCGKRDAVLILVALGALTDYAIGKIPTKSPLSVKGNDAIEGKFKVYEKIDTSTAQKKVRFAMEKGTIDTRTRLFDALNGLDTNSIKLLTNDGDMMGRFLLKGNYNFYTKANLQNVRTAKAVNFELGQQGYNDPYMPNTSVSQRITNQKIEGEFIRFHGSSSDTSVTGRWLVRKSEIVELHKGETNPANWDRIKIKEHLALPSEPNFVSDATIPANANVKLREGVAGPNFGSGGGGYQFEILDDAAQRNWFGAVPTSLNP